MFFDSWDALGRTLLSALLTYVLIITFLRISGKRTLAKWNAFDFVVTIALGSMVATTIISKQTTVMQGAAALGGLILLQWIVTSISVRVTWFRGLVKGSPVLIFRHGKFLYGEMERHRITESEILAAMREKGIGEISSVDAVVLENNGTFSVIGNLEGEGEALRDVRGWYQSESQRDAAADRT